MNDTIKEYLIILGLIFSLAYIFWPIPELEETIPAVSIAVTSAEIGPEQISAISRTTCLKSRPDFLMREGFVVTPSRMPQAAISLISSTSAVSKKNSMFLAIQRNL